MDSIYPRKITIRRHQIVFQHLIHGTWKARASDLESDGSRSANILTARELKPPYKKERRKGTIRRPASTDWYLNSYVYGTKKNDTSKNVNNIHRKAGPKTLRRHWLLERSSASVVYCSVVGSLARCTNSAPAALADRLRATPATDHAVSL